MTNQKKLEVIEEAFNYYHDRTSLTRLEEKELTDFVYELKAAISVTRCCDKLPVKIEVTFDGNLLAEIETTDKNLKVLRAVNGWGTAINCEKIRIYEVQR
tara:strand:- start:279 stop:578 length:300 start_codon:yes stop_codon:yes gene_type:complete